MSYHQYLRVGMHGQFFDRRGVREVEETRDLTKKTKAVADRNNADMEFRKEELRNKPQIKS